MLTNVQAATYAALRIVAGFLFLCHGLQKVFGLLGGRQVELMSRLGAAGLIELIGGALIVIGAWTSPVAFLASGEMAFAYFLGHYPRGGWPIQNGGEPSVLYCFLFLYMATRGSGAVSVDRLLRKRRT